MELLLHYCWQHKIFPLAPLETVDKQRVEVINPGLHNKDSGPDFFNAKLRIGGQLWVGNVEIHEYASDWFLHHHDTDAAYDNVILHVVRINDRRILRRSQPGELIPQLQMDVPDFVQQNYLTLAACDRAPRCAHIVPTLPSLLVHGWMSALTVERLEERTRQVEARRTRLGGDWEATCFVTMARYFGFGINGEVMERWAESIPLGLLGKVRDEPLAVEAIFFGQAGLLCPSPHALLKMKRQGLSPADFTHQQKLLKEYEYQRHKFGLVPIDRNLWRTARLRPQNAPQIRLAQLVTLYCTYRLNLSRLLETHTLEDCRALLATHVEGFWQTHYGLFAEETPPSDKQLSAASRDLLITNAVTALLFAYGRYKGREELCERALDWLEKLPAEHNRIIADWEQAGVPAHNAADTQALLQLTRAYCEPRNCLRCRFGYEYLRHTPDFLKESELPPTSDAKAQS